MAMPSNGARVPDMRSAESLGRTDNMGGRPGVDSEGIASHTSNTDNSEPKAGVEVDSLPERLSRSRPAVETGLPALSPTAMNMSALHSTESSLHPISPHRAKQPHMASPGLPFQLSPRVHSPASSQIFERSVQEDMAPAQASPSIPSHIMTENHIPPILEASSAALTDDKLDPGSVEIVTHNYHQPASLPVMGAHMDHSLPHPWHDDAASNVHTETEDSASIYGALDSPDVKRLSFVSFADLVHGEQVAESTEYRSNRNSMHMGSFGHLGSRNRSISPLHSPTSSRGLGTSPPTSMSSPPRAMDASPHRTGRFPGSPGLCACSPTPPFGGELSVETMRQALRKTESGDLGGCRSQPMSAVGSGDNVLDREQFFK